jgi:hypothetical protein
MWPGASDRRISSFYNKENGNKANFLLVHQQLDAILQTSGLSSL